MNHAFAPAAATSATPAVPTSPRPSPPRARGGEGADTGAVVRPDGFRSVAPGFSISRLLRFSCTARFARFVRFALLASAFAVALAGPVMAPAFPPAPHHTLFGLVRNQWGDPIDVSKAVVYLTSAGGDGARSVITPSQQPGVNYYLRVPMDSMVQGQPYQSSALRLSASFRLKVQIGTVTYLPIEMVVSGAALGLPGQSTRLDLTLGVDSDGDGLPDAWEQGIMVTFGGTLVSVTPEGDADGDGISNLDEYRAGTLPFDAGDGFRLALAGQDASGTQLEFVAVRGRSYTVQSSSDLRSWVPVQFRVVEGAVSGPLQASYYANDIRSLRLEVPAQPGATNRYFKATVQ